MLCFCGHVISIQLIDCALCFWPCYLDTIDRLCSVFVAMLSLDTIDRLCSVFVAMLSLDTIDRLCSVFLAMLSRYN